MKLRSTLKFGGVLRWLASILFLVNFGSVPDASSHGGRGINGGQLFDTGGNHIELIGASGYEILMIAITDEMQKPVAISGIAAYISVERAGQKVRIPLESSGGNILSARDNPHLVVGESVRFVAKMSSGVVLNAQFTSK